MFLILVLFLIENMEVTIQTMYGTFIVPAPKIPELVMWLKANAVQANTNNTVQEIRDGSATNRHLLND